jgi:lysophospholipase L1-like esterase
VLRRAACLVSAAIVIGGCGGSNQAKAPSSAATGAAPPRASSQSLVTLGDAIVDTAEPVCNCTPGVAVFARRIGARLNNRAASGSTATDLLKAVTTDSFGRQILRTADDIVISMGINDLPWNRPDLCSLGHPPAVDWAGVDQKCIRRVAGRFEHAMNAVLTQIDGLRAGKPTMLRLIDVYNSIVGDTVDPGYDSPAAVKPSVAAVARFDAIQCRLASEHHGRCVDVQRAFNGPNGSRPARRFLASDYLRPSAQGQQVIADLLYKTR